jgi:sec-independent protein translocase protein TatA
MGCAQECFMPGGGELVVIFVLVLLLFGPDKLPELARGVGKGLREIRKVSDEFRRQLKLDEMLDDDDKHNKHK